ncbi:MAG: hypothetical protein BRD47_03895 [Bacteroidetes bacterium QS_8_68_28]|nr:MAG: hypothetical protein BRD47_03895 [Bacteroidetes bacterium QS_8_68_28]
MYEELVFRPSDDGGKDSVRYLKRSDDYGNARRRFARRAGAFPAHVQWSVRRRTPGVRYGIPKRGNSAFAWSRS